MDARIGQFGDRQQRHPTRGLTQRKPAWAEGPTRAATDLRRRRSFVCARSLWSQGRPEAASRGGELVCRDRCGVLHLHLESARVAPGKPYFSAYGRLPPIGFASRLPVWRNRLAQRSAVDSSILKCVAASRPLMPAIIAATTRSRRYQNLADSARHNRVNLIDAMRDAVQSRACHCFASGIGAAHHVGPAVGRRVCGRVADGAGSRMSILTGTVISGSRTPRPAREPGSCPTCRSWRRS
jgi:hypothetical protein